MLKVSSVNLAYGSYQVLEDVSLECTRGEIVGLVGRSGTGKTSLLNLICGYEPLQSGRIEIDELAPAHAVAEQKIGYVFQRPVLMPWLSVWGNVALPYRLKYGRHAYGFEAEINRALQLAQIAHARELLPHQLSGGMQARASIARAIACRPSVLLLDEPFTGLDDPTKEMIYQDIQSVVKEFGMSTLLVSHDLNEAVLLCDRVYVISQVAGEASRITYCEDVPLGRPREIGLLGHLEFLTARQNIRENLG